jgi:hypothetical protein
MPRPMVFGGSSEMEGAMVKREKREIGFNFRVGLIF